MCDECVKLVTLLQRWNGAMIFSGVAAAAEEHPGNPLKKLLDDTTAAIDRAEAQKTADTNTAKQTEVAP